MNDFYKDINSETIRIALSDGTQIKAYVNIDREPGYDRLSDLISAEEPFLILMNATMYISSQDRPINHETLFINKDHIVWATPVENQG